MKKPNTINHLTRRMNAFVKVKAFVQYLDEAFRDILGHISGGRIKVEHLARDINLLIEAEADAVIASISLLKNLPYTRFHPIQCAIISILIADSAGFSRDDKEKLTAAALTANIGMLDLQEDLHKQTIPLTEAQRSAIHEHPFKAVSILTEAHINNKMWLDIVRCHHEFADGSGYPRGLHLNDIPKGAQILSVADRYTAMMSNRSARRPLSVSNALRQFLLNSENLYNEEYALRLIKELTIYPPGSFVKLKNGDTAIVIKRGEDNSMHPEVRSILNLKGEPYDEHFIRDTSNDYYSIESIAPSPNIINLNINRLWGYV